MARCCLESYRGAHIAPVLDLLAEALPADAIGQSLFVRKVLLDPNFQPEGATVATDDSGVVGFALAIVRRVPLEDAPMDTDRGYLTLLAVHPSVRRRGIGGALLERAEAYIRSRGAGVCLVSPYAPGYFTPGVDMHAYAEGLAFLTKRGYVVYSRPISMECDLGGLRTPSWVQAREAELGGQGIAVEHYDPSHVPALMTFLRQHFPGDWQRFARTAIAAIETGDRPDRLWVARHATEVVGYSHHEGERFGPIGVAEAYRSMGIGHVLLYRTLDAMRMKGLHTAWFLWSDDTTARRLYAGAGFVVRRRFAVLRKDLHP